MIELIQLQDDNIYIVMQVHYLPTPTSLHNQFQQPDQYEEDFEEYHEITKSKVDRKEHQGDKGNEDSEQLQYQKKNQVRMDGQKASSNSQLNKAEVRQNMDRNRQDQQRARNSIKINNSHFMYDYNHNQADSRARQSKINDETMQKSNGIHYKSAGNNNKQAEDRESRIKQTISKLTKNILFSKKQIVEDISRINHYHEENQKTIKNHHEEGTKQMGIDRLKKEINKMKYKENPEGEMKMGSKSKSNQRSKFLSEQQIRNKQAERRKKKQILLQQKQARKQQQLLEKSIQKKKKNEIQKRMIYEQKFISRRTGTKQVQISPQQIKAFENAFIQQIKERLNIGKSKHKMKSLDKTPQGMKIMPKDDHEQKRNYNMKINKGQKLKQRILKNLKQRIHLEMEQFEPTYPSIITSSNQFQEKEKPLELERKRTHKSAPQLRLPAISQTKPIRRTFYSKGQENYQKVHILKLSNDEEIY